MHDYGYVVVNTKIDTDHIKQLFWRDLQKINPKLLNVDISQLWNLQSGMDYPTPTMQGLVGEYGLSHGEAAWHIRCNDVIKGIFSQLLFTQRLVVSFDAIGYSTDLDKNSESGWLHVDQNPYAASPMSSGSPSLQGIFYAEDVKGNCATTVVLPGSHKMWRNHVYTSRSHFQIVDTILEEHATRLVLKAGDLLIFNSKLVHQGWHGPHRLCFMVSYGLKDDRTEQVRRRKIMMYLNCYRSSHWSQLGLPHGYKITQGNAFRVLKPTLQHPETPSIKDKVMWAHDAKTLQALAERADPASELEYKSKYLPYIPSDILQLL